MLLGQIKSDVVVAMKMGQALKLSVLRMLLSAINYKQIEMRASLPADRQDLSDEEILAVIGNEAKKRREAIASYQAAHREAQVAQEQQELEILQAYLPTQLGEAEIRTELAKLQLPAAFGQAMKITSPLFRGRADGSLVARIVKEQLGNG